MKILITIFKLTGLTYLLTLARRTLRIPSIYFLLGTNIFMLVGFIFLGWDFKLSILIFWLENIIIAFSTYFRIRKYPNNKYVSKNIQESGMYFFVLMFFTLLHGMFLMIFLATDFLRTDNFDLSYLTASWDIIFANVLLLIISYALTYKFEFLDKKAYLHVFKDYQFSLPFIRILFFHLFLLIGIFVFVVVGYQLVIVSLFIILKIFVDIVFTYAEIYSPPPK